MDVMQRAWDALLSDWMELLSGCLRVWEADQLTSLLSSPGEELPPHTALVTMFEAGDYRTLVSATQHVLSDAFAVTEDFRKVLRLLNRRPSVECCIAHIGVVFACCLVPMALGSLSTATSMM